VNPPAVANAEADSTPSTSAITDSSIQYRPFIQPDELLFLPMFSEINSDSGFHSTSQVSQSSQLPAMTVCFEDTRQSIDPFAELEIITSQTLDNSDNALDEVVPGSEETGDDVRGRILYDTTMYQKSASSNRRS